MNWFTKLFSIGVNSVNDAGEKVVDSLVDVRREGKGIVRAIDENIKTLTVRVEEAQVEVCLAHQKIAESKKEVLALEKVAKLAVDKGNDDDALNALTRIENHELLIESHNLTITSLQPIIDAQLANITTMSTERTQINNEILRLDIEEKAYKARLKLLGGEAGEMAFNISDLRERVQRVKAKVEAKEMISTAKGQDLVQKYEVNAVRTSVQDRLNDLKKAKVEVSH